MLGIVYGASDLPFDPPDIKSSSELSEDEQFSIIDRAINGDLKGVIPVTQQDIELYNRRRSTESYANEYRRATEFSYIPRYKQQQVKEERARAMGLQPPSQTNPVLNGYQAFNSPQPSYYGGGYYGGYGYNSGGYYNNPYGYNSYYQQPADLGNPVLNFVFAQINQPQISYGGYYNPYDYNSYYRPKMETFGVNPNMQPSQIIMEYAENAPQTIQEKNEEPLYIYPEGFNNGLPPDNCVFTIPKEFLQLRRNNYNPYTRTAQFYEYIKTQQEEQNLIVEQISRILFGSDNYDELLIKKKEELDRRAAEDYRRRHSYDSLLDIKLTPDQMLFNTRKEDNMARVASLIRNNPYNISFKWDPQADWQAAMNRVNSNKAVQEINSFFNSNMTFVEFFNEALPRYMRRQEYLQFCRDARINALEYDADKYRSALFRSGVSSTPFLGFSNNKPIYDPKTNSQITTASAPQSIADRYNERRARYLQEAAKRGGVV